MKILQICNGYFDNNLYKNFFNSLNKNKIENIIFVFLNKNRKIGLEDSEERKVIIEKCYSNLERIIYYYKQKKVFNVLLKKVDFKEENIDFIHAHTVFSNGDIAYRLKKNFKIPYIVAVRNTDINVFFKYMFFLRKYGLKILKEAEKIIFLSPKYKEYFFEKYIKESEKEELEKKVIIIPNGVDKFWLNNLYVRERKIGKRIRLIQVGNIDKNKNINTTINVCKKLLKKGYLIELIVIGKLFLKPKILQEDFIKYIPYCNKEELIKYYRNSDIFILPSKFETFGLVYVEALTQGLPIIYTRGQGFDKQIPDGEVGYSVTYNNSDEIVEKIEKIIKNYEKYYLNIQKYLDKFDWENISKQYIEIYKAIEIKR